MLNQRSSLVELGTKLFPWAAIPTLKIQMSVKTENSCNSHCTPFDGTSIGILSKGELVCLWKMTVVLPHRFDKAMIAFLDCVNQVRVV